MTTTTTTGTDSIHHAEQVLRGVLDGGLRNEATDAASSLERILLHLKNMRTALESTPGCRPNVTKRLRDFSVTTARMATNHPSCSKMLNELTDALRSASTQVGDAPQPGEGDKRADAA